MAGAMRLMLLLAVAGCIAAAPGPGRCDPNADIIADGLYGAAETQAAIARTHDPEIARLRDAVLSLTARAGQGEDVRDALTGAKEMLLKALAERDRDYGVQLKQMRLALEERGLQPGSGGSGFNLGAHSRSAAAAAAEREQRLLEQQRLIEQQNRESERESSRVLLDQAFDGAPAYSSLQSRSPPPQVLPSFPWPPPTPSERLNLTRRQILPASAANPSLADAGERIVSALQAAGYSEFSFYAAPRGFAIVARLERIEPDGTPAPQQLRFLAPNADEPFSLAAYVSRLFFAPEGYYRQIVFAVTTDVVRPRGPAPNAAGAEAMLAGGADRLPPQYRTMPFTSDYQVVALIYEYRKDAGDGAVKALAPGRIDARTNLVRAGLYRHLVTGRD